METLPALRPEPSEQAVVFRPRPFASDKIIFSVPNGTTIEGIVLACGLPQALRGCAKVWIDDYEVPRHLWRHARPNAGRTVYVAPVPQGGDGGKGTFATILMIAVAVAAAAFAQPLGLAILGVEAGAASATQLAIASFIGGTLIMGAGALLSMALIPPPKTPNMAFDTGASLPAPNFSITGVSNRATPYGPIPRVFGRRRVYPVLAARPYSETEGNKTYFRVLLLVGYGPIDISDLKIGETPIESFSGTEWEINEGGPDGWEGNRDHTLYTQSIREDSFNLALVRAGETQGADDDWVSRISRIGTREISIDISFPGGLAGFPADLAEKNAVGDRFPLTVELEVRYRKVGDVAWSTPTWVNASENGFGTPGEITITDMSQSLVRRGGLFRVAEAAQYEVQVRRTTTTSGPSKIDLTFWTALRSIAYETPITEPQVCTIAIRMLATGQLNGVPDQINCIATSYLPVYTGSGWEWELSRNPAWAYTHLLRTRGAVSVIPDHRIDLEGMMAWADACDAEPPNGPAPYWTFDGVIEGGSLWNALKIVAAHGRAAYGTKDGKHCVVRDVEQETSIQPITPRNSWAYEGTKLFVDLPHAIRVRFVNEELGYQEDELVVYDDGYTEENATRFETLDMLGSSRSAQSWREGRYFIAVARLRPELHRVYMSAEQLRCTTGDLVRFAYDTILVGLGTGRVLSREVDDPEEPTEVTSIELDTPVTMEEGKSYAMRCRQPDGTSVMVSLVTEAGQVTVVEPVTPIPPALAPDAGDLFEFGEAGLESMPAIVRAIEPGPDWTARLTLHDAQPGIYTADQGEIPPFQTYITQQQAFPQKKPPAPTIVGIRSDESALLRLSNGELQDRIAISLGPQPATDVPAEVIEAQYREAETQQTWLIAGRYPADAQEIFIAPVIQGFGYNTRVRSISHYGVPSDWATPGSGDDPHVVVGKSTPPATVAGFAAERFADGVQLSWTPNTEPDIDAYRIKRGASYVGGTVVNDLYRGTSLFVALDTADAVKFFIVAVDVVGNESLIPASLTSSVVAPGDVQVFDAAPQDDRVRFAWQPVDSNPRIEYEIREGASWAVARVLARVPGNELTIADPIAEEGDVIYWIKAVSPAGLYSANAHFRRIRQAPSVNRNVILSEAISPDWDGVLHGCEVETGVLTLSQVDGMNAPLGEYYHHVDLGDEFYARSWVEFIAVLVAGDSPTWEEADFTWEEAGDLSWLGELSEGPNIQVVARIHVDAEPDDDLIEGWTLNGSLTAINGSWGGAAGTPIYAPARYADGLVLANDPLASWAVSFSGEFNITFQLRLVAPLAADFVITMLVDGDVYNDSIVIGYDATGEVFYSEDFDGGNRLEIELPQEAGDVIMLCLSQSDTTRALRGATLRHPTVVSDDAAETSGDDRDFVTIALFEYPPN